MAQEILLYLKQNAAELLGFLFGIVYVVLAIQERYWCWIAGILNVVLYALVFLQNHLYGAAILQVIYLGMSVYGLFHWLKPKGTANDGAVLSVTRTSGQTWGWVMIFIVAGTALSGYLLSFTDNAIPWWDGLTTALGLVATWMTARKLLENWLVWIVANLICCIVYAIQGLYPTVIYYFILAIMAWVGYHQWKKSATKPVTL